MKKLIKNLTDGDKVYRFIEGKIEEYTVQSTYWTSYSARNNVITLFHVRLNDTEEIPILNIHTDSTIYIANTSIGKYGCWILSTSLNEIEQYLHNQIKKVISDRNKYLKCSTAREKLCNQQLKDFNKALKKQK